MNNYYKEEALKLNRNSAEFTSDYLSKFDDQKFTG